jgi:hypothetical protein
VLEQMRPRLELYYEKLRELEARNNAILAGLARRL